MSTYPTAPAQGYSSTGAAPTRPSTLTAAVVIAVVAGLAAIANAVVVIAGGTALVKDLAAQTLGDVTSSLGDLGGSLDTNKILDAAVEQVKGTYQSRAYVALVGGIALLIFGLAMRNAATWARVLVTISAVLAMGISFIVATDLATGLMKGLGWVTFVACVLAIVFAWLSPNGRYAKARKAA